MSARQHRGASVAPLQLGSPTTADKVHAVSVVLQEDALALSGLRSIAASALMVAAVRILCEDFEPVRVVRMLRNGVDDAAAEWRRRSGGGGSTRPGCENGGSFWA